MLRISVGLSAMLCAVLLSSCAAPKNMEKETNADYSGVLQRMQSRMDSLVAGMSLIRNETSDKLSNLKVEQKTFYYYVPDSAGNQYPSKLIETSINKSDNVSKSVDTEFGMAVRQLATDVSELKKKVDSAILEKGKEEVLSWWDLHRDKVYAGAILLLFVFVLTGKLRKGG